MVSIERAMEIFSNNGLSPQIVPEETDGSSVSSTVGPRGIKVNNQLILSGYIYKLPEEIIGQFNGQNNSIFWQFLKDKR